MRRPEDDVAAKIGYGGVSGTDSESDREFLKTMRGQRIVLPFKWNTKNEELLEEILIKHNFCFKAATREFTTLVNKDDPNNFFEMTSKKVELRWTDIEIRKHRLSQQQNISANSLEEELPPIQEEKAQHDGSRMAQLRGNN